MTVAPGSPPMPAGRAGLVRRGLVLNYLTIAYNVVEALVAIGSGVMAGSVALVGFGVDSAVEVAASGAALWRLRTDHDSARRELTERRTRRIIGGAFIALALYVTIDSAMTLWRREAPEGSIVGIAILVLSVIVMPVLARAKRRVAVAMGSRALEAESTQTSLCAWLSAIALVGVGLNALAGWWWADPVAAIAMVPIIMKEGIEGIRARPGCDDCR